MYPAYYNFKAEPFRLSPDHNFAYSHKAYNKARAYMEYALMRAEGFVMITGQPGTGKTTLVGALTAKLSDSSVSIANLVCTQLEANDLLKLVAYEFGIPVSVVEKGEILQRLTQQLKLWHKQGRRALLIVDEAQDLSISAMEELRLLTNIQVGSLPLLQIFLLGQPELRSLILSPQLEQVHQRIIAATHMKSLDSDETEAYVRHRLCTVGWHGDPAISKPVYPLIHKFSEGIPRRINLICSRLFLHCAVEEKHQVSVADMREVIQELQSEQLASGSEYSELDFQVNDVFEDEDFAAKAPAEQAATAEQIPVYEDDEAPALNQNAPANNTSVVQPAPDTTQDLPASPESAVPAEPAPVPEPVAPAEPVPSPAHDPQSTQDARNKQGADAHNSLNNGEPSIATTQIVLWFVMVIVVAAVVGGALWLLSYYGGLF